ncbi:MAG TPA: hypothetical protein DCE78_05650 [Bacteroidetes bacterium]|nr:hypothetical protein [Bacteroidota bacterium]
MPRFLFIALLSLFIFQCSRYPSSEKAKDQERSEHISIQDTIPKHIQQIENLTVFPGDSEPRFSIELIPEQTFGQTGEPYLTNILSSVVDDQGRVIILDTKSDYSHVINVFNDDGSFHTQLGGPGKGPGEYGFVLDVQIMDGKVIVRDFSNQRLNIYNTNNYSIERTLPLDQLAIRNYEDVQGLQMGLIMPRHDGNYLVSFYQPGFSSEDKYLLMDADGNRLNIEPLVFPSSQWISVRTNRIGPSIGLGQLTGQTLTSLSSEDALFSIWTRDFLIKKYDSNGLYQSAIYYPLSGLPIDIDRFTSPPRFGFSTIEIEKALENVRLPETNPILDNLIIDDENRIWVAVPMDTRREMLEWWILAPSGELLAKLQHPRESRFVIKNGHLFSKETDENSGVEFVVKYRIEFAAFID